MDLLEELHRETYNFNYAGAEITRDIPIIGKPLLALQKLTCDIIYDPLAGGNHVGCDGVDDVYHGLPNKFDVGAEQEVHRSRVD